MALLLENWKRGEVPVSLFCFQSIRFYLQPVANKLWQQTKYRNAWKWIAMGEIPRSINSKTCDNCDYRKVVNGSSRWSASTFLSIPLPSSFPFFLCKISRWWEMVVHENMGLLAFHPKCSEYGYHRGMKKLQRGYKPTRQCTLPVLSWDGLGIVYVYRIRSAERINILIAITSPNASLTLYLAGSLPSGAWMSSARQERDLMCGIEPDGYHEPHRKLFESASEICCVFISRQWTASNPSSSRDFAISSLSMSDARNAVVAM